MTHTRECVACGKELTHWRSVFCKRCYLDHRFLKVQLHGGPPCPCKDCVQYVRKSPYQRRLQ